MQVMNDDNKDDDCDDFDHFKTLMILTTCSLQAQGKISCASHEG